MARPVPFGKLLSLSGLLLGLLTVLPSGGESAERRVGSFRWEHRLEQQKLMSVIDGDPVCSGLSQTYPATAALRDSSPACKDAVFNTDCGGVLVHPEWVLTAGHCAKMQPSRVLVGSPDLLPFLGEKRGVVGYRYNGYDPTSLHHDIALLKLDERALTPPISILKSPNWEEDHDWATLVGWGRTNTSSSPCCLHRVVARPIDLLDCACKWKDANSAIEIGPGEFCTDASAGGACKQDSGGPVMVEAPGQEPKLVGIVSAGCNFPNRHTRVASHLRWMTNVVCGAHVPIDVCFP